MAGSERIAMVQVVLDETAFNLDGMAFVANCYQFVGMSTSEWGRVWLLGIGHRHGADAKRDDG
jgi:hypothetical protein